MVTNYPINPRVRAYGKARIDIAQRVKTAEDWEKFWRPPSNPFPFTWGDAWRQSIEYKVIDFAAEVGFFVDILGLQVNALHSSYAMFTSPGREFFFTVVPAINETDSTPPGALRLQFMLSDLLSTTRELEKRGILFDQLPEPIQPGSSLFIASFRTPNGMPVELWGNLASIASPIDKRKPDGDRDEEELIDDEEDDDDEEPLEDDEIIEDDEGELVEDEDTDVDETGISIDEDDGTGDDDDIEILSDEDEDTEEEDDYIDDEDLEEDEDDFDFDEEDEDEYDNNGNASTSITPHFSGDNPTQPPSPTTNFFNQSGSFDLETG